jgi:hypothetical protein
MTDESVSHYIEFYRVNLNGEKKTTEWFLGSNLQCCLHATALLTAKDGSGKVPLLSTCIFRK